MWLSFCVQHFFFTCTHFWCFSFLSLLFHVFLPHAVHLTMDCTNSPSFTYPPLILTVSSGFISVFLMPPPLSLSNSHTSSTLHSAFFPLFLDPPTFWTVSSAAVAATRHPTFSSSSLLIAGCCGHEEGRGSDSEMCHFEESKAVSGVHSAVQVQAKGMPLAHLILLTMGINWPLDYKTLWCIYFQNVHY